MQHSLSPLGLDRRRLQPRAARALLVGAAVLVVLALVLVLRPARVTAPAADATPRGTFRATEAQWAGLRFAPVATRTFRARQRVDGIVATNDDKTTPVFSPFSGRVVQLVAGPGDMVKEGDPLFIVEASEFVQAQNDLLSAAATLETARAQARLAQTNEVRQHELFLAKGAALKDWQQAQVDQAAAQAALRNAETAVTTVRNRLRILGNSDADIAALEKGNVRAAGARTTVGAPIGGTVIQRQVAPGQYIQAGASAPVYTIGDLSHLWLLANVRESDAAAIRVGQHVEARVLALPDRSFTATITYVGSTLDPATHRLPVRAEVENPDGLLKPTMFADLDILTGDAVESPSIPVGALVREGDTARVWVAGEGRNLALRDVQCGLEQDGQIQITSGVSSGERVVTSGALFIDRAAQAD